MKTVGLLINPIAGMGGKAGLKGTDGKDIVKLARERGAVPESLTKTVKALEKLVPLKDEVMLLVASGSMGEMAAEKVGLNYAVVYEAPAETDSADTEKVLRIFREKKVDLILFAGGDGTAKDVVAAVELSVPVIGIPTGVKIHSPVYALTPEYAGEMAAEFLVDSELSLTEKEVIDIEEEAFRHDEIHTQVYGYLNVPDDKSHMQNLKSPSPQSEAGAQVSAALQVIDEIEDGYYYIIGSGSTTSRILEELDMPVTQLGVDIIKDGEFVAKDVYEQQILDIIGDQPAKLIVTPMGGQGYLFGRGNQQLSDKVLAKIEKDDVIILSTPGKINTLYGKPLLIYTGNAEIDQKLSGYYKIVVGYGKYVIYKAQSAVK